MSEFEDEETILVCMRVANMGVPEKRSSRGKCELCGEAIWIGASSPAAGKYQCMQCVVDTIGPDAEFAPITQEQLEAVREYFRKYGH